MSLRTVQILVAVGNCVYGALLLSHYGQAALAMRGWPPTVEHTEILLVAVSVLPFAIISLRFPTIAGILQFACAFIGSQLAHNEPTVALLRDARISMAIAMAILAIASVRGIVAITPELFEATELASKDPGKLEKPERPRRTA